MKDYKLIQQQYSVGTYANRNLVITHGEGLYLFNEENEKYLDVMTNYGVSIFGHSHPSINRVLTEQLSKIVTLHGSFSNDVRAEAMIALIKRAGKGLSHVYLSNSGAEAVEAALKFAVLATRRKNFIACKEGYHGKTLGALSATGEEKYQEAFKPLLWNFSHIPYNNPIMLEKAITAETAAFIVEPIQGEGGIFIPDINYLNKVREICDRHHILLILDEIQTGCGRTGRFLASHINDISYDIVCMGKGLAGGIPVGATLVSNHINEKVPKGSHTSTFGGNPMACAGISATLELLSDTTLQHIKEIGLYFRKQLKSISSPNIVNVRGEGLMIGVEVAENRDKILQLLQKEHILAIPAGKNVVRFLPAFTIQKEHIDLVVLSLQKVLTQL